MTSTDDSDHGGPRPAPRRSPRPSPSSPSVSHSSGAGSAPRFENPRRERFFDDGADPRLAPIGASARASWEELAARRGSILATIQAEADAAVAELDVRQSYSRVHRRQRPMSSRLPEAVDAEYVERKEDIEDLCDILLEEYGVEVEKLPPGARAPIYSPTVRAAWPVTEEGAGRERERRSRRRRGSRPNPDLSENEASEEDDEVLVNLMSRGPADRLRAQTSFRDPFRGDERPFGGDYWRRRHDPYDDSSYEAPGRPRPKPRGPGPGGPPGIGTFFAMAEDETREEERDWERERERMRDRVMKDRKMRDQEMRAREMDREIRREREMRMDGERGEIIIRRRSEYPSSGPRPGPRSRSPPGNPDVYMRGGRHENDAPAPAPEEGESENDGVRRRRSGSIVIIDYLTIGYSKILIDYTPSLEAFFSNRLDQNMLSSTQLRAMIADTKASKR